MPTIAIVILAVLAAKWIFIIWAGRHLLKKFKL